MMRESPCETACSGSACRATTCPRSRTRSTSTRPSPTWGLPVARTTYQVHTHELVASRHHGPGWRRSCRRPARADHDGHVSEDAGDLATSHFEISQVPIRATSPGPPASVPIRRPVSAIPGAGCGGSERDDRRFLPVPDRIGLRAHPHPGRLSPRLARLRGMKRGCCGRRDQAPAETAPPVLDPVERRLGEARRSRTCAALPAAHAAAVFDYTDGAADGERPKPAGPVRSIEFIPACCATSAPGYRHPSPGPESAEPFASARQATRLMHHAGEAAVGAVAAGRRIPYARPRWGPPRSRTWPRRCPAGGCGSSCTCGATARRPPSWWAGSRRPGTRPSCSRSTRPSAATGCAMPQRLHPAADVVAAHPGRHGAVSALVGEPADHSAADLRLPHRLGRDLYPQPGQHVDLSLTVDDLAWVRSMWPGPLIVKGSSPSPTPGGSSTRAPTWSCCPTTADVSSTGRRCRYGCCRGRGRGGRRRGLGRHRRDQRRGHRRLHRARRRSRPGRTRLPVRAHGRRRARRGPAAEILSARWPGRCGCSARPASRSDPEQVRLPPRTAAPS